MKKISITTRYFQTDFGDRDAIRMAAESGADAIDFDLCGCSCEKPNSPYTGTDAEIEAYYRDLGCYVRQLGLEVGQTHGRMTVNRSTPEQDRVLLENARLDCLATRALGAPVCVMHGVMLKSQGGPDTPDQQMRDENFRWYCDILKYAKQYGVKIAVETMGNVVEYGCCEFIARFDEFVANYERVCAVGDNAKYFTVCVDTGHAHRAVAYGQPSVGEIIRRLGDRVTVLHLNDNEGVTDQHKMPFNGSIDWEDVFNALDEIGYTGPYSMELLWRFYGSELMGDYAAFAVKTLRSALERRSVK